MEIVKYMPKVLPLDKGLTILKKKLDKGLFGLES